MAEEENVVLYEEDKHVATITLNRPQQMNACSHALRTQLGEAMFRAENNTDIRVIVVTGAGRGFSAGADLTEGFTERHATISQHILKDYKSLVDHVAQSDKTYIAALHGATAGVMIAFAMACDMVVMGEGAFLYSPFRTLSLVPDGGASWYLLQTFGYHATFEMIAEGRRMDAKACQAAGLTSQIVPDDQVCEAAQKRAQELSQSAAPLSLKYAKKILRAAQNASREDITVMEAEFQHVCSQSDDFQEGVSAFLQKRSPKFTGK